MEAAHRAEVAATTEHNSWERHPKGCTCSPRSASAHRPPHPLQGGGCVSHELSTWAPRLLHQGGRLRGVCAGRQGLQKKAVWPGERDGRKAVGASVKGERAPRTGTDRLEEARGAGWYQRYLSCVLRPSQCKCLRPQLHLRASSCSLTLPARPVRGLLGARPDTGVPRLSSTTPAHAPPWRGSTG